MIPKFKAFTKEYGMIDVREINFVFKTIEFDIYVNGVPYARTEDIENIELLQSTGLKDKNGTEIYEGDILKESSMLGIVKFGRYLDYEYIQYGLDGWLFSEKLKLGFVDTPLTEYVLDPHCSIEVIGNIYEHQHLLEEE